MEKVEFKVLCDALILEGEYSKVLVNSNVFRPGDRFAPPGLTDAAVIIQTPAVPTVGGWEYTVTPVRAKSVLFKEGTVVEHTGSSNYSEVANDWGKVLEPEEVLTSYQAVKLAIETLENFVDEYSDVQPVIDKLKRSLS